MSLSTGRYIIRNNMSGQYVGRSPREDRSLLPKRIVSLAEGTEAALWVIEMTDNGYILRANGAPIGVIDNRVWAILLDMPPPTFWRFQKVSQDEFMIVKADDEGQGWAMPSDELGSQAIVRPIDMGNLAPDMLWTITRVDE
ncbi:hypothetical protein FRB93_007898 [Tulasnella sp. JGI-2019a]|nr:hypothetical protein FRB93_007898 [Tulasnella sp. JGI-2019a]